MNKEFYKREILKDIWSDPVSLRLHEETVIIDTKV